MDSQQRTAASPRSPPRQGHDSTAILFTLLSFFAIVALVPVPQSRLLFPLLDKRQQRLSSLHLRYFVSFGNR